MSGQDLEQLNGKNVLSQDGMDVGDISSFTIDPESWKVVSLVVKVDRDALETLKLRRPLLGSQRILIPVEEVSGVGKSVVLKSKIEDLTFYGGEPAEEVEKPAEKDKSEKGEKGEKTKGETAVDEPESKVIVSEPADGGTSSK